MRSLEAQEDYSRYAVGVLGSHSLVSLNRPSSLHSSDSRPRKELCDFDCLFHLSLQYTGPMYLNNLFFSSL